MIRLNISDQYNYAVNIPLRKVQHIQVDLCN